MIAGIVRRWPVVVLAVVSVVSFGSATYISLPRESSPDIDIPVIIVSTPYIGVSPEDIERLVSVPMENELSTIRGLKTMSSTSSEGVSIVRLEFETEVDIADALQRVRDKVSQARVDLPEDVEETDIRELSIADFPIMMLSVGGPVEEEELKRLGELLEEDIERIPGVLEANLSGGRTREIRVQVDPDRMNHYGIGFGAIMSAIQNENVNTPGGDVNAGDTTFLLRVPGEFPEPAEIENVAIKRIGDRPVFVRDVARVVDGFADRNSFARMNGDVAVTIAVTKRAGGNILEIADAVKALAAEHRDTWPEGVEFAVLADESKMVRDMVSELENGILTSLVLVSLVLLFFMGIRNASFVAFAIPLSMLLAILVIGLFGMTLNMIVLFSLIMAMGMLVDNAIVIVENIYRHVEEGRDIKAAAIMGTQEVAGAVTASTATTVAAFTPLLFWTGVMGSFMGFMPKTIVIVLISSLVVAVFVLPVLTAVAMKKSSRQKREFRDNPVILSYRRVLEWSIDHRYISALFGLGALVGTFAAYGQLNHGVEFFPEVEPNRATVNVRAPDGTDVDATDAIVRQIEALIAAEENVETFVAESGIGGAANPMAASEEAPNWGRITIDFLPDRNSALPGETVRVERPTLTIDRLREGISHIAGAEISIEKERMGPVMGSMIQLEVTGTGASVHEVGALAARVRRVVADIPGTVNITDDYRSGRPEMRFRIDRGAAKRVGVNTSDVANTIRTAVAGTDVSTYRDGEDEYDIVVEVDPAFRNNLQSVLGIRLPGSDPMSPDTFPVPMSTVASYELAGGSGSIRRDEQQLMVTISGDVAEGENIAEVREAVLAAIAEMDVPEGFSVLPGGASEEEAEQADFLAMAGAVAIVLIAFVLVWEFNSFLLPFIILASVVLSIIGVLWGLVATGTPFGIMMTGLGVISLAGIVVNNAIVLLDYVEQLRHQGISSRDALIEAGLTRFRPVVLTAITTVLGLVPMATGVSFDFRNLRWIIGSESATWWGPMAIAVIAGLVVATVLTLVMVPTLYGIFEDMTGRLGKVIAHLQSRSSSKDEPGDSSGPPSGADGGVMDELASEAAQ